MCSIPLKQLCLSSGLYCRKLTSGSYIHGTFVRRFTSHISNRILLPHIGASWSSQSDSKTFLQHKCLLHNSYKRMLFEDKLVNIRNAAPLCYKHLYCGPLYCYEQNSCKSPDYRTLHGIHYNQCGHYCTSQGDSEKTKHQKKDLQELLEKENVVTVPNMLTMTRIILTPFLGYLVLQESFAVASVVFMIAGLTDFLDGYIARNFKNQTSAFGSFLDPLADKLLVSMLYVTLTLVHLIPVPLAVLVIARDALLIAAAFYVRYISLPPPKTLARYFNATKVSAELKPLFISKLNTALQLLLVAASLTAPVFDFVNHPALQCLWYATAATTVASGVGYMFAKGTFRELRKKAV